MKRVIYLVFVMSFSLHMYAKSSQNSKKIPVEINPGEQFQTLQGWGGSLCWWANIAGNYPDDSIKKICDWITDPVNGLNMNIFRFNIGGGDNPEHDHMRKDGGAMPGYKSGIDQAFDWSQDSAQRKVLKQLIVSRIEKIGKNDIQLVAFSNSPPWWMTKSLCAAGNVDGDDNLKDDMYGEFADYLTEVVKYYHDSLGIVFNYIEPFNEPDENWWKAMKGQEGCFFSQNNQIRMIRELYKQLKEKNMLSYTQITANDANTIDAGLAALNAFKSAGDILDKVPLISVHSYGGKKRNEIHLFADENKMDLWQSESGPLSVKGSNEFQMMTVSNRIVTDLNKMKCTAWIDWQLMADKSPTWGLVVGNYANGTFYKGIDFYLRVQFSRYLKAGYKLIENTDENIVTALSPDARELVIVLSNNSQVAKEFEINISKFSVTGEIIKISTRAKVSYNIKNETTEFKLKTKNITLKTESESVTTLLIPVVIKQ